MAPRSLIQNCVSTTLIHRPSQNGLTESDQSVRCFLRSTNTGAFFKAQGSWTKHLEEALDFETSLRAIEIAYELRLQDVEMIVVSQDGEPLFGSRLCISP